MQKDREAVVADLSFAMRRIAAEIAQTETIDGVLSAVRDAACEIETLADDCRVLTTLRSDEFAPVFDALVLLLNTVTEWCTEAIRRLPSHADDTISAFQLLVRPSDAALAGILFATRISFHAKCVLTLLEAIPTDDHQHGALSHLFASVAHSAPVLLLLLPERDRQRLLRGISDEFVTPDLSSVTWTNRTTVRFKIRSALIHHDYRVHAAIARGIINNDAAALNDAKDLLEDILWFLTDAEVGASWHVDFDSLDQPVNLRTLLFSAMHHSSITIARRSDMIVDCVPQEGNLAFCVELPTSNFASAAPTHHAEREYQTNPLTWTLLATTQGDLGNNAAAYRELLVNLSALQGELRRSELFRAAVATPLASGVATGLVTWFVTRAMSGTDSAISDAVTQFVVDQVFRVFQ